MALAFILMLSGVLICVHLAAMHRSGELLDALVFRSRGKARPKGLIISGLVLGGLSFLLGLALFIIQLCTN